MIWHVCSNNTCVLRIQKLMDRWHVAIEPWAAAATRWSLVKRCVAWDVCRSTGVVCRGRTQLDRFVAAAQWRAAPCLHFQPCRLTRYGQYRPEGENLSVGSATRS